MKKIRMIVSAVAVFAIVGGSLAFKTQDQKLFVCQSNICVISDPSHNYEEGAGQFIPQGELSKTSLQGLTCAENCNRSFDARIEN